MSDYQNIYYRLSADANRLGGLPQWLLFRLLPVILLALLLMLFLGAIPVQAMVQEEGVEGFPEDIASGQMLLRDEQSKR